MVGLVDHPCKKNCFNKMFCWPKDPNNPEKDCPLRKKDPGSAHDTRLGWSL